MGLTILIIGLAAFIGGHVFVTLRGARAAAIARMGEGAYKILAIALVIGGAYVSSQQADRFGDEPAAPDALVAVGTLIAIQDCPYGEASCILGQGIERALQGGHVDAVMEFGAPRLYICPGPERSDSPSPLCDRVGADEGRVGYPIARRGGDASVVVPPEVVRATLKAFVDAIQPDAQDAVGDGEIRLYAFSCSREAFPAQNLSCAREGIILSAILDRGEGVQRELLVFWAEGGFGGRTLPFTELWDGVVPQDEVALLFETGGRLADLGEVDVIDQSLPR
jgi:hypothetical protein